MGQKVGDITIVGLPRYGYVEEKKSLVLAVLALSLASSTALTAAHPALSCGLLRHAECKLFLISRVEQHLTFFGVQAHPVVRQRVSLNKFAQNATELFQGRLATALILQ